MSRDGFMGGATGSCHERSDEPVDDGKGSWNIYSGTVKERHARRADIS
jgi:hypothetical protein